MCVRGNGVGWLVDGEIKGKLICNLGRKKCILNNNIINNNYN